MKSRLQQIVAVSIIIICAQAQNAETKELVSIESLLNEMIDRDSVARYPELNFRLKQHSSYNRASKTPDDPEGWFNNKDFSSKTPRETFIRVEENNGRKEWVLMDHQAPGSIVRTWMPFRAVPKNVLLRFYLDGSDTPQLEGNPCSMLNGSGLIPYPFAHPSVRSAVSFIPIPYAESCKVTLSELPFFFQFTFREYDAGTPVKTFTMEDLEAANGKLDHVGRALLNPQADGADDEVGFCIELEKGKEKSLELSKGEAAVRELSVKLGSYRNPEVTRKVVLRMEFDGKETVWCPLGDLFGCGIGLHPFQGWYRTVAEDGTMTCRWVMPYKKSGRVSVVNLGDDSVGVELKARTGDWEWDERSMYFHAGWRGQYPVPTRPYSDWNYVTLRGRGVYVGDTLTIMNPVERWWGEGDEKIWVDGEDFPSIFGTGTEDYYAYSWGGVSTDFYEHPFHAQPRCHKHDKLNRKRATREKNTMGYSTETRSRALDTMPFGTSLKLDMEVWSWTDCEMGYQVGCYWYGFKDTTSNRKPEPQEVLNVPPLPDRDASAASRQAGAVGKIKKAVEIEKKNVISKPAKLVLKPQDLGRFRGLWNESDHILFKGGALGDSVELKIPTQSPVAEKLVLYATRSYDYGSLRFTVNGKPAGTDVDFYGAKPVASGAIELGTFEPVDGVYILRAEVVGKNPKSKGMFFGLDCVSLSASVKSAK